MNIWVESSDLKSPTNNHYSRYNSPILKISLLILLVLLAYIPAMKAGYVWDDSVGVTNNYQIRSLAGLLQIWVHPSTNVMESHYWPLVYTFFWIGYHLWGLSPMGYHVMNILFHCINVILIFYILQGMEVPGAWFAAAIFGIHPVHLESVAWVIELKDVLSGFFYLLSFKLFMDFYNANKWKYYLLALLTFIFALLSKSITISLPIALLLWLWWKGKPIKWKQWVILLPFFALAVILSLADVLYAHRQSPYQSGLSILEHCFIAGHAIWFYIGKLIFPVNLMTIYPRWDLSIHPTLNYLYPVGIILLVILLFLLRNRIGKGPLVAFLYFIVTLGPVLGFIDFRFMSSSFVADRFQYLASIGLIALFAAFFTYFLGILKFNYFNLPVVGSGVIILIMGLLCFEKAKVYKNTETLFRDNLARNPKAWLAHYNLGVYLDGLGRFEEAKKQYNEALTLKPTLPEAINNIGVILENEGKHEEAIREYLHVIKINPNYAEAYNNLGLVYAAQGEMNRAIGYYRKALSLRPAYVDAHINLGLAYAKQGQLTDAVKQYEKAISINPDSAQAHNNFGIVLAQQEKMTDAATQYQQAIQLKPDFAQAYNNFGILLVRAGNYDAATTQFTLALKYNPDYENARTNLESLLSVLTSASR